MTAKEAYRIVCEQMKDFVGIKCTEFDSVFVFAMIHKKHANNPDAVKSFDSTESVNKLTGEVRAFNPIRMPIEEYRSGKVITNFK